MFITWFPGVQLFYLGGATINPLVVWQYGNMENGPCSSMFDLRRIVNFHNIKWPEGTKKRRPVSSSFHACTNLQAPRRLHKPHQTIEKWSHVFAALPRGQGVSEKKWIDIRNSGLIMIDIRSGLMVVNQLSISATFLGLLKRGIPWSIETVYPMAQWSFHRAQDTRFCYYYSI